MDMMKPLKHRCTCNRCGARFVIISAIGRSIICDACAAILLTVIWPAGIPTTQGRHHV